VMSNRNMDAPPRYWIRKNKHFNERV